MSETTLQLKAVISAENKTDGVFKDVENNVKNISDKLKEQEENYTQLAVAGAAAFAAIAAAITYSLGQSIEAEQVNAQLGAVLKSTGLAAGVFAEDARNLAQSLSMTTAFGDEAVMSAQNLLLTFTKVGQQIFPEATAAMLDMSVAMGQDLKSSAMQVGKALNDPITGIGILRKSGVTFTQEQMNMIKTLAESGRMLEAQKIIVAELAREFGGSATAQAKTFGGQLSQLKNATGDAAEAFGNQLMPVLSGAVAGITKAIRAVEQFTAAHPALAQTIAALGLVVTGLVAGFGAFKLMAISLIPLLRALGTNFTLMMGPIGIALAALSVAVPLITDGLTKSARASAAAWDSLGEKSGELATRLKTLRQPIEADSAQLKSLAAASRQAGDAVTKMYEQMKDAKEAHDKSIANNREEQAEAFIDQQKKIADLTKKIAEKTTELEGTTVDSVSKMSDRWAAWQEVFSLQAEKKKEEDALKAYSNVAIDIAEEIKSATIKANKTEFERKIDSLKAAALEEDKQFKKKMDGYAKELVALKQARSDALTAEKAYTAGIAAENAQRVKDYKKAVEEVNDIQKEIKKQTEIDAGTYKAPVIPINNSQSISNALTPGQFTTPVEIFASSKTPAPQTNVVVNVQGSVLKENDLVKSLQNTFSDIFNIKKALPN